MRIGLIRSGGFAGIEKKVVEELEHIPTALHNQLETFFSKYKNNTDPGDENKERDGFNYFLEYNNQTAPVNDSIDSHPELKALVNLLKTKLV